MGNGVQPKKSKRATNPVPEVEASSGNVFADLDVSDADEALAKAELARRIHPPAPDRRRAPRSSPRSSPSSASTRRR